jgi:uncharacterized protein YjiS (DUF1127 family)
MMQESLIGEFCRPSLDHRRYQRRIPAALPGTVWAISVGTFASVLQHGLPSWVSPDVPLTRRVPRRAVAARRRIVAAIRLWRWRARSRQQLRELSDHLLKDIGLYREELGYGYPKPLWHGG